MFSILNTAQELLLSGRKIVEESFLAESKRNFLELQRKVKSDGFLFDKWSDAPVDLIVANPRPSVDLSFYWFANYGRRLDNENRIIIRIGKRMLEPEKWPVLLCMEKITTSVAYASLPGISKTQETTSKDITVASYDEYKNGTDAAQKITEVLGPLFSAAPTISLKPQMLTQA